MSSIQYEKLNFEGWDGCHRLSNGIADLVVSGNFGPRVLRFGYSGEANLFHQAYDSARSIPDDAFRLYGGHRLWHAPENPGRTYVPDNTPVQVNYDNGVLSIVQAAEPVAQVEKALDIALDPTGARAIVTHTLTNRGVWPVELSVWALSVMRIGGTAVLPLPPRAPHSDDTLLPTNTFTLWSYTDFSDPRWAFSPRSVLLNGSADNSYAQKIGASVPDGWLAYWYDGTAFVKRFDYEAGATYPDNGSSAELYTNGEFLELESLAPLTKLAPGESAEHVETWLLTRDLPEPDASNTDSYFTWIDQNG